MKYCDFCYYKCDNPECDLIPRPRDATSPTDLDSKRLLGEWVSIDTYFSQELSEAYLDVLEDILDKPLKSLNSDIDWKVLEYLYRKDKL